MLQSFCCLCCLFFLCLPLFAFVYLPLFLLSKIPHCPHCLVFDRVLSEFTRSTRFPSFLLPLSSSYHSSSYHSLPPTTLFLLPLSSSYHSLPPTVYCLFLLPLPLCTLPTPTPTPTLYHPLCTTHSTHSTHAPTPPTYQPTPSPTAFLASSPPLRYFPNWPLPAYTLPRGIRHGRPPSRPPRSPSKSILSTAPPPPHNIVLVHIVNHFVNPAMSLPKRQKRVGSPRTISTTYYPRSHTPSHYPRSQVPTHSPTLPKQQPVSTDRSFAAEATNRTTEA